MAFTIELYDGTTTVALNSGTVLATRYAVQSAPPQMGVATLSGDLGLSPFEYGDVTEGIELFFSESSIANLQTTVSGIRRMLELARLRQLNGVGPRVYLQVQYDGESEKWRSEILSGRLLFDNAGEQISRLKMEGLLSIQRRFFFETVAEKSLLMTSSETTTPAATVVAYNNDDATAAATNYALIAAAQVTGSLPAPLRLRITNAEVSALNWGDFYIANYVFAEPLDPFLLGAEAAGGATFAWATDDEENAFVWELSNTLLTNLAGRRYNVVLALDSANADISYRAQITATNFGFPLDVGRQILGNAGDLFNLGSLRIPPDGDNVLGTNMDLVVTVQKPGGGTVIADFAQLMPAGDGLFRRWEIKGGSFANGVGVEDNGPEGTIYYLASGRRLPVVAGYGKPIHVWPGKDNRLRFVFKESVFVAARKVNISAWYRPRRADV